jgi:Putative nucleotidyltransferase DUF294/Putative nucleotidyltransferase substrate binding domain
MPLFRRKPPGLPLRMPRLDGSSWPDRRDVERRSFAALTLYQMGYREAFEPEAATIADRLVEEVLPMFAIDSAPGDAPYLRQVFVSAAQIGAGIGIVDRRTAHPDERSIDREVGRALWAAVSELPAMPPEQRRIARYLLQAGHYVARTGFEAIPRMLASLADDDPSESPGNRAMEPHNASPVRLIEEIDGINRLEPLDAYQSQLVDLVRARLAAGVNALDVTGAVADANDSLTRHLLGLAESHLGPPPCRYVWLALGSHGRREQVLSSDQDSAIAYELTSPHDAAATDEYFAALAALVVDALARAGIPLCGGGYMATNWHRPLDEFEGLFRGWVEQPQPEALLKAEVFLDVRACHGELSPDELIRILLSGGSRGPFRTQMARSAVTFRPPSLFGRLRIRGSTLDVKRGGTAAIVLLARLYALVAGSAEHSTVLRLQAAAAAGTLSSATAGDLIDAYRFLTELRLRHQIQQADENVPADNGVLIDRLTAEQRTTLRAALRTVHAIQEITALRFATDAVM